MASWNPDEGLTYPLIRPEEPVNDDRSPSGQSDSPAILPDGTDKDKLADFLFNEYGNRIQRMASRRGLSWEEGKDVVQESLKAAWEGWDGRPCKDAEGSRARVYGIARHKIADVRRRKRRRKEVNGHHEALGEIKAAADPGLATVWQAADQLG
jgi:DNA-directed RNA polymerase specialized sigma24 family protein